MGRETTASVFYRGDNLIGCPDFENTLQIVILQFLWTYYLFNHPIFTFIVLHLRLCHVFLPRRLYSSTWCFTRRISRHRGHHVQLATTLARRGGIKMPKPVIHGRVSFKPTCLISQITAAWVHLISCPGRLGQCAWLWPVMTGSFWERSLV